MNRPSRSLVSRPTVPVRPAEQAARHRVGREGQRVGGLEHPCARRGRDLAAAVDRLGGGRDGHPGLARDVAQRGCAALRCRWASSASPRCGNVIAEPLDLPANHTIPSRKGFREFRDHSMHTPRPTATEASALRTRMTSKRRQHEPRIRRRRAPLRAATAILATGALIGGLAACSGGADAAPAEVSIGPEGVDDGIDPDAVDARAAREAGEPARRRLQRATRTRSSSPSSPTTTTSPRSAPPRAPAASPTSSPPTSSTCPTGSSRACSRTSPRRSTASTTRTRSTRATSPPGTYEGKEHVLPFVLDLSMLLWNKDLFERGGPRPREGPGRRSRSSPSGEGRPGARQGRRVRHRHGPELRRMPRLHVVPDDLGRGRGGHERGRHRVAARERHGQGGLLHVEGPRATPAPCCPARDEETGPTWTAALQEGNVGVMPYPATLLSSTRRSTSGVAGIPGPGRRRVDVRRRRRHRRLEGLREGPRRRGTSSAG